MARKGFYSTGLIRRELSVLVPGGVIHHDAWHAIRAAAEVTTYRVDRDGWLRLCAAFALYRRDEAVTPIAVHFFLKYNGDDPVAFLPGLLPIDLPAKIPAGCQGAELQDLFLQWLGVKRSESTIRGWCESVGLSYGRRKDYQRNEIYELIRCFAVMNQSRKQTAIKNLRGAA